MSETPRTDTEAYKLGGFLGVSAIFASQLERELTAMTIIAEKCRVRELEQLEEIKSSRAQCAAMRDALAAMASEAKARNCGLKMADDALASDADYVHAWLSAHDHTCMTKLQRILALEAALCACEGAIAHELGNDLKHWLDGYLNVAFPDDDGKGFGRFLEAQQEAVNALAASPQVFGGLPK